MTRIVIVAIALSILSTNSLFATPPTLQDFLKDPTLQDVDVSPNGRYLAEIWNKDNYRTITIKDLNQTDSPIVARLGDNIIRAKSIAWANNDRLLVNIIRPFC